MQTYNIVEICKKYDKNARHLIETNQRAGYDVRESGNRYVIILTSENVWHAEDAVYREMPSGTYVFKGDQVYLLEN